MNKKYVKLNENNRHLSLGNLFRILKEEANNKNYIVQSDLFCILFNIDNISDTTVNNYCTGARAINSKYKNIYVTLKSKYEKDEKVFIDIILNIAETIDKKIYKERENYKKIIEMINSNEKMNRVCLRLYNISKNDIDVSKEFASKLKKLLDTKNLYSFFIQVLFFVILDKKQPVYIEDKFMDTLDSFLYSSEVSSDDAIDFVTVQLKGGLWSIREVHELAKHSNPYACFEMGSLELYGEVAGYPRYQEAYNYFLEASKKSHPNAIWAIGHMYYNGFIGTKTREDMKKAFICFNRARKLNCICAINSLGIVFKNGDVPFIHKDRKKAKKLFELASSKNYVYAINNLGVMYEEEGNLKKAFETFKRSADRGESWALNKIGQMYRMGRGTKKDLKKAYDAYTKSTEATIYSICFWSKYNIAHYYLKDGVPSLNIPKDREKCITLLEECIKNNIDIAYEDLIYLYFEKYKNTGDNTFLDKAHEYANIYISKDICDDNTIDRINSMIKNISKKEEKRKKLTF